MIVSNVVGSAVGVFRPSMGIPTLFSFANVIYSGMLELDSHHSSEPHTGYPVSPFALNLIFYANPQVVYSIVINQKDKIPEVDIRLVERK